MKSIEFIDVDKSFPDLPDIVAGINFSCIQGNTYFLYGKNGTGKSTIIKLLLKDLVPDSGTIKIFGDDISRFSSGQTKLYKRELGIIFQDLLLVPYKTVFENIAMPLIMQNKPKSIITQKTNTILKDCNLDKYKHLFPDSLPFGLRQKIGVARALITDPKIIIADEPVAHMDTEEETEMWGLIKKYKNPDTTILWATSQEYLIKKFPAELIEI